MRIEDARPCCFMVCMMGDEAGTDEALQVEGFSDLEPGVCSERKLLC